MTFSVSLEQRAHIHARRDLEDVTFTGLAGCAVRTWPYRMLKVFEGMFDSKTLAAEKASSSCAP